MLPQPIVPHEDYEKFRSPLRSHQAQAVGEIEAQGHDAGGFDLEKAITTYQRLITELPPLNRQLLLYILDLLAVFASKSEHNRMTSPNLAAIFQPGMLSHPGHDMQPAEYRLSQDVIIFLIENQDSFLVGMSGTAVDENTVREVQGAAQRQSNPSVRATQVGLGRSASNASAGADSLRKQGGFRRNVSVSSKNSKASNNVTSSGSPAPGSPLTASTPTGGVHRSNTVPSQRSPGIPSGRFRNADPSTPTSSNLAPVAPLTPTARSVSPTSRVPQSFSGPRSSDPLSTIPATEIPGALNPVPETKESDERKTSPKKSPINTEKLSLRTPELGVTTTISAGNSATPTRDRRNLFSKSPSSDTEHSKDNRHPNKLRKKRIADVSPNASAQSSSNSLSAAPESPAAFYTPMPTPAGTRLSSDALTGAPPTFSTTDATPSAEEAPKLGEMDRLSSFHVSQPGSTAGGSPAVKASKSPSGSLHSKASVTEESEFEPSDDRATESKVKKRRWRLSSSTAKPSSDKRSGTSADSRLGSSTVAERSVTSVTSEGRPRKSITKDLQQSQKVTEASASTGLHHSSNETTPSKEKDGAREKDSGPEDKERKGPMSWIKGKVARAKEERKEREAERERAKSPPRNSNEHATSKQSLGAIAQEGVPTRGLSTEAIPEVSEEKATEPVGPVAKEP